MTDFLVEPSFKGSPKEALRLLPDHWLSGVMDRRVFRAEFIGTELGGDETRGIPFGEMEEGDGRSFAYIKIATDRPDRVARAEALGFRVVDTNVTLERPIDRTECGSAPMVRFVRPEDEEVVASLARESFAFSRFHLDPGIEPPLADRIKEEWMRNGVRGKRGDWLIVAEDSGVPGGFLLLLGAPDALVIDLIAVGPSARGKGFAKAMIRFAERRIEGFERYRVGTQIANVPSMGLYENLGFRVVDSAYVLHRHFPHF
jgi:ribosomal protein S18 acetylase RimI-like enzyme